MHKVLTWNARIYALVSRWLPVLIWASVIFMASANSDPYKPLPSRWIEPCFSTTSNSPSCAELLGRVLHIGEYAVLAALTMRALVGKRKLKLIFFLAAFGISSLYGLMDEIHQLFVPGRAFQLMDLALDCSGGMIGLIIYTKIRKYGKPKKI